MSAPTPSSTSRFATAAARASDNFWLAAASPVLSVWPPISMRVPAGARLIASAALLRMSWLSAEILALSVSKWTTIRFSALTRSSAVKPAVSFASAAVAASVERSTARPRSGMAAVGAAVLAGGVTAGATTSSRLQLLKARNPAITSAASASQGNRRPKPPRATASACRTPAPAARVPAAMVAAPRLPKPPSQPLSRSGRLIGSWPLSLSSLTASGSIAAAALLTVACGNPSLLAMPPRASAPSTPSSWDGLMGCLGPLPSQDWTMSPMPWLRKACRNPADPPALGVEDQPDQQAQELFGLVRGQAEPAGRLFNDAVEHGVLRMKHRNGRPPDYSTGPVKGVPAIR